MNLKMLSLLAALAVSPAFAADNHSAHQHGHDHAAAPQKPGADTRNLGEAEADGTVNAIDPDAMLMNITHGPVPTFKWPAMTMDLPVADAALFEKVQPGDKVKFKLRKLSNVDYTIVQIEKR